MARWRSGWQSGGPVTIRDPRVANMRELLLDLSRPGVCIVLGAGASHGLVPLRITEKMIYERMSSYHSYP